jgi:hypothetical protein
MTCPSCGGKLTIQPDIDQLLCLHCGNQFLVKRNDGSIALKSISEKLTNINIGIDRTALELTIKRIKEEVKELKQLYASIEIIPLDFGNITIIIFFLIGIGVILLGSILTESFGSYVFWGLLFLFPIFFLIRKAKRKLRERELTMIKLQKKENELNECYRKIQ